MQDLSLCFDILATLITALYLCHLLLTPYKRNVAEYISELIGMERAVTRITRNGYGREYLTVLPARR